MAYRVAFGLSFCVFFASCSQKVEVSSRPDPPLGRAVVLLLKNQPLDALKICNDVLKQSPEDVHAIVLRGEIYEALGNKEEAIAAYQAARDRMPYNAQASSALSRLQTDETSDRLFDVALQAPEALIANTSAQDPLPDTSVTRQVAFHVHSERDPDNGNDGDHEDSEEFLTEEFLDARLAGDDKSYRTTYSEPTPQKMPSPNPLSAYFTKLQQTIADGQRLDRLDRERQSLPAHFERMSEQSGPALEDRGRQIVRFDLGLGIDSNFNVASPPIRRTTGNVSMMQPTRPFDFRRASRVRKPVYVIDTCQPSRSTFMLASHR